MVESRSAKDVRIAAAWPTPQNHRTSLSALGDVLLMVNALYTHRFPGTAPDLILAWFENKFAV
jgi:hypothetical protein